MTYAVVEKPSSSRWPATRRFAWYALFAALLGWAALVDPAPGVYLERLPVVGDVSA